MDPRFEGQPQPTDTEKSANSSYIDEVEKHIKSGEFTMEEIAALPPESHSRLLLKVIKEGDLVELYFGLHRFHGLDADLALKMIDAGLSFSVVENLDKFMNPDLDEIAQRLIKTHHGGEIARFLPKFPNLDHKELAELLIQSGCGRDVASNLFNFNGLDHQKLADELIEKHLGDSVAENLRYFEGVDHNKIAAALLANGESHTMTYNFRLRNFKGLNGEIATGLIEAGDLGTVVRDFNSFDGLDNDFAKKLMDLGHEATIVSHLERFRSLDAVVALTMIMHGYGEKVANNIKSFLDADHPQIADALIVDAHGRRSFVVNLENFQGLNHVQVADKLIAGGFGKLVARNLENFQDLNHAELVDKLFAVDQGYDIADNLEKFKGVDHVQIADRLIANGDHKYVVKNLEKFKGLDHIKLVDRLISYGELKDVVENLEKFKGLDHIKLVDRLIDIGSGMYVAEQLEKFKGVDHVHIAEKLMARGDGSYCVAKNLAKFQGLDHAKLSDSIFAARQGFRVAQYLENFNGLDHVQISDRLIANNLGSHLAQYLEKFQGINHLHVAEKLIAADCGQFVAQYLRKFNDLNDTVALQLIALGEVESVASNVESFLELGGKTYEKLVELRLKQGNIRQAKELNSLSPSPDRLLKKADEDFGDFLTIEIFRAYQSTHDGKIPEELKRLGVKRGGDAGLNEMIRVMRDYRHALIMGSVDLGKLGESPILTQWVKAAVRFDESQWGSHEDEGFSEMVEYYAEHRKDIRPLPKGYESSPILHVAKIDEVKQAEFAHSEGFLSRYRTLLASIQEARALVDDPKALNIVLDRLKSRRDKALVEIDAQIARQDKPKAIENLIKRKAMLESVSFEVFEKPQEAFNKLASFDGMFNDELRVLMLYAAYRYNPEQKNQAVAGWKPDEPTLDQLSWTLDFIDHIANQETMAKYFTDKKAAKKFKGIMNVSALEQELARWQNQATDGTADMRFVPNRDLLTEFSGHFSDACWASKYESILEAFPNFIGLTIVQNPDDLKDESIAGGAFLIEADDNRGTKYLIIRGLNPRENVINRLSPKDFMDKLVGYLKPMAEKLGRKLAIVIDDHAGGSGTNRPVLYSYLAGLKASLFKAKFHDPVIGTVPAITEFNGYKIENDTYLL